MWEMTWIGLMKGMEIHVRVFLASRRNIRMQYLLYFNVRNGLFGWTGWERA